MSKGFGGLFNGIISDKIQSSAKVWDYISSTQGNYDGTELPRSFVLTTPLHTFWVHGNATEHVAEYLIKQAGKGYNTESTKLSAQIILSDMHAALSIGTKGKIEYNKIIKVSGWEFIVKPARSKDGYDAVIHALYRK